MRKLLLLPCLFIVVTSLAQTKLIIQSANERCTIVQSNANYNPGDQGFWAECVNKSGLIYTIRGLLQFDLSSIPQGSKVNWARLSLFSHGDYSFGPNAFMLRRITSPWDPNTVIWNTQPSTTKRGQVKLPTASEGEDYKNIDVWKLVQPMIDSPATSYGFMIRLDTENSTPQRSVFFISPVFKEPHKNPKLVIEYTAPGFDKQTTLALDMSGSTEMSIYPNPSNGIFAANIKSTSTDKMSLRVIDLLGRTVYTQPVNISSLQMRINLPFSSAGTYFVVLQDNQGATIVSQQLQVN